jgi:acetate---CoA ligase (ADP-forming)
MLTEVTALEVLRGYRGLPEADLDALVIIIVNLSNLAMRPEIAEAEINPVLVRKAGAGAVAVDAAVRMVNLAATVRNSTKC